MAQISGFQSRTPGGKFFTIFDESYKTPSQWGADAVLTKDLGAEYDELWIETWIKFQPDWVWADELNGSGQSTMKYLRCRRHTGDTTDSRFSFFGEDGRSGTPVGIRDLKSWTTDNGNYLRPLVALRAYTDAADFDTENDYYDFFGEYDTRVESGVTQGGEDSLG